MLSLQKSIKLHPVSNLQNDFYSWGINDVNITTILIINFIYVRSNFVKLCG